MILVAAPLWGTGPGCWVTRRPSDRAYKQNTHLHTFVTVVDVVPLCDTLVCSFVFHSALTFRAHIMQNFQHAYIHTFAHTLYAYIINMHTHTYRMGGFSYGTSEPMKSKDIEHIRQTLPRLRTFVNSCSQVSSTVRVEHGLQMYEGDSGQFTRESYLQQKLWDCAALESL